MEVQQLYVVYDSIAQLHGPIFEAVNDAVAIRNFKQMMAKSPCPEDYSLFCIGQYDSKVGVLIVDYDRQKRYVDINIMLDEKALTKKP